MYSRYFLLSLSSSFYDSFYISASLMNIYFMYVLVFQHPSVLDLLCHLLAFVTTSLFHIPFAKTTYFKTNLKETKRCVFFCVCVCVSVCVCITYNLVGNTGPNNLSPSLVQTWVKLAAVQRSVRLQCQIHWLWLAKLKQHFLNHRNCVLGRWKWNCVNFLSSNVSLNDVSGSSQSCTFTDRVWCRAKKDALRAHLGMFAGCLNIQTSDN